jgi:hypothetical protein
VVGFGAGKGQYHVRHDGNERTGKPIGIKPENLVLYKGSAVIVEGLDAAPEWNGKHALVESYDAAKGRYRLMVKGRTKPLGVKVACCKLEFAVEQEQQERGTRGDAPSAGGGEREGGARGARGSGGGTAGYQRGDVMQSVISITTRCLHPRCATL